MAWEAAIHSTRKQRAGSVRPKGNDAQMEILTDKRVSFSPVSPSLRIIPTVYGFRPVYHSMVTLLGCGAVWSSWPCTQLPKFLDLSLSWMVLFQCVYSVCCSLGVWTAPSLWLYSIDWCQPSFWNYGSEPQMGQVTNLATWICCSQNKTQN